MAEVARHLAVPILDALITAYGIALALIFITGGVNLGILSVHEAAKPLLVLLAVVPLRVVLGGRSWLTGLTETAIARARLAWVESRPRLPPSATDALFAFSITTLVSLPAGFLAHLILEPAGTRGFSLPVQYGRFVEIFAAWDSGWYWDIARRGYYYAADGQSSIAFFPLYPLLIRWCAAPFGGGDGATWITGILVSATAFLLALVALHRLTEKVCGNRETARRTVLYVAVFPWSLFFTRVYAESVFLLVSVLAVSRAHDGRWWQAGWWGALATLARPNGILIGLPLALLALRDRPEPREAIGRWARLAPIPAALAGFCGYAYTLSGNPFGWMAAQAHWGYSLGHPPWQQLQRLLDDVLQLGVYDYLLASKTAPFELLHGAAALIFLALVPLIFRRLGAAFGMYVLVSLLVPLSSNTLEGLGRYASVLFPAFMAVATLASPRAHEAILVASLVFGGVVAALFVTLQPIY